MFTEIFLIGAGLSADAFAVSLTNGLSLKDISRRQALGIAAVFGIFQGVMPLLGFMLGSVFAEFINAFAPYIALAFLGFIGGKMLVDGFRKSDESKDTRETLPFRLLIMQGVATSIDALIVGVSFIAMGIRGVLILPCVAVIGVTTFTFSFIGVGLGKKFGKILGGRAKIAGGLVLIGIGLKVFIEHFIT